MNASDAKFCCMCGNGLIRSVPEGDQHERAICHSCGHIHYENPKVVVACIAHRGNKVLWIRRGTEPQKGRWAIPSGFAERGETPEQAAARELFEETGAVISPESLDLYLVGSLPEISEVYLVYHGVLPDDAEPHPTVEAAEVAFYSANEVPWDDYAYPDVADSMRQFYSDNAAGHYGAYVGRYQQGVNTFTRIRSE